MDLLGRSFPPKKGRRRTTIGPGKDSAPFGVNVVTEEKDVYPKKKVRTKHEYTLKNHYRTSVKGGRPLCIDFFNITFSPTIILSLLYKKVLTKGANCGL